ncbi:MAG: sigma factor [Pseudomonadota bacterium]|nr:sigma factor [Pseudomonadota bacterium]MED6342412.1 sigma factor [Pseudomonadota bacterium]
MTDDELMSAVQRQDKDAFASLMARHLDSLYGYALRLTQEPSNAEDLVQETWLRVWANAKKYKQDTVAFST